MIKDYTFKSSFGQCKYEFKDNCYCFTATSINNKTLGCKFKKDIITTQFFSTEGDIMDTCRGMIDILMVAEVDFSFITRLKQFKDKDMFIVNFIGNYHSCLLENTPWSNDMLESLCGMFSNKAAKYFKEIIRIYKDLGDQVIVCPIAVKEIA